MTTVSLPPMKCTFRLITLILFYLGIALPALGHEFWLEPQDYQPETGATLQVKLRNGQRYSGTELGYFDDRAAVFDWIQNGARTPVQARAGDFPALTMPVENDGLLVLVYEAKFSKLQYNKLEKFLAFAEHKDFPNAAARHFARGLPNAQFSEIYTRYCKSLIGVGAAGGQDDVTGMATEFVALNNPYTDDLSNGFAVKLLYQGQPRIGAQIEVFDRAPDGMVKITYQRTDDLGQAVIPVTPDHSYLLDAVVLREPDAVMAAEYKVVWESLWASMTFMVPN